MNRKLLWSFVENLILNYLLWDETSQRVSHRLPSLVESLFHDCDK